MPCYKPLEVWRSKYANKAGKFPVLFTHGPDCGERINIACGQCVGCRLERKRLWAVRLMHEAQIVEEEYGRDSMFITLTYDEEHLPFGGSLVKHHFQDFMKRFRRHIEPQRIRYYMCGEYGTTCEKHEIKECPQCGPLQRPHYHAIIFGFGFPDKEEVAHREGYPVYTSEFLHKRWPLGLHEIGNVTFESCAYVAGYIVEKRTGEEAIEYYHRYLPEFDAWCDIEPEFSLMSQGIGNQFYALYYDDMYPKDQVYMLGRGNVGKPPKYYDLLHEESHPEEMEKIREQRVERYKESIEKGPSLASKEKVALAKLERQRRSF